MEALDRIAVKKSQLDARRPLSTSEATRLKDFFDVEWTYHSNAIEGSSLTLRETEIVLHQGLTIGGKPLREHLEVINHKHAIDFVEALARGDEPLTEHNLRQIHTLVLRGIDDEEAQTSHTVERAALAHFRLVDIHPFADGNGRTARLLMNLILMRDGYPPAVVRRDERLEYYEALDAARAGDTEPFVALMAAAVERSLDQYLAVTTE